MLDYETNLQPPARIVLVGFMGAGKSTVGARLAARLGWKFVDSDRYLEEKHAAKIHEFFARFGEHAFRRAEAEAIAELMDKQQMVLALGGGSLEDDLTRSRLFADSTMVVHLSAPFEVLVGRCEMQEGSALRPILQQRGALEHRFHSRLPHYELADLTVSTHGVTPDAVVDRIFTYLNTRAAVMADRSVTR